MHVGHTIAHVTIAKIEAGARGVGGHITDPTRSNGPNAAAARIPGGGNRVRRGARRPAPEPLSADHSGDEILLAPDLRVDVDTAHAWDRGHGPLDEVNARFYPYLAYEIEGVRAVDVYASAEHSKSWRRLEFGSKPQREDERNARINPQARAQLDGLLGSPSRSDHRERRQASKGGFRTQKEAQRHLATVITTVNDGSYIEPSKVPLARFLADEWLPAINTTVRPSTHDA